MTAPGTIAGFSIFVVMEATQKDFADPSAAIKQWAGQFEQEMLGWAYKKTNDHNQAADIVQETFIAAFQAYDSFKGQSKPKTWLFSILKNKITDFYRKKYRKEVVNESQAGDGFMGGIFDTNQNWQANRQPHHWDESQEELLDNEQFRKALDFCMKQLPELWHTAMQLKYLEERNGPAICKDLGITQSNFWQILHRAKLQLRECITNEWFNK